MNIGTHVLIECEGDHSRLSHEDLKSLMIKAANTAGSTVLYDYFHQFGGGGGMTGVLVLAESHITVHQWPEQNYAAFDVFMCADAELAAKVIAAAIPEANVTIQSIVRGLADAQ